MAGNKGAAFKFGLLTAMKDPGLVVKENAELVVIKDKYPKVRQSSQSVTALLGHVTQEPT